jgi:hypothetical protein
MRVRGADTSLARRRRGRSGAPHRPASSHRCCHSLVAGRLGALVSDVLDEGAELRQHLAPSQVIEKDPPGR